MINLFSATCSDNATAMVIGEIGKNNGQGTYHYVIVPDRFSLSVEREIFERLHLDGAMNIEVVSFTRLAVKILKAKAKKCLSKNGAVIVLRNVIDSNIERLVHYKNVASGAGFPKELYAVIAQIRTSGYSPEDIEAVLPNLSKGTRSKMQDVAILYRAYVEEIESHYEDTLTRIDKFIGEIPKSDKVKAGDFYIVGFSAFSQKQKQVIGALGKYARSVNIGLTPTNNGKNSEIYPAFMRRELLELCEDGKIKCEEYPKAGEFYEGLTVVQEPFATLNKYLLAGGGELPQRKEIVSPERVTVYEERNVFEEINGVAHEIAYLVRRKGYRYKDIAIVNCDSSTAPIVKSIFERYDIPLYCDTKYPLTNTLCASFLLRLLEMVKFGFRRDKVIRFIKEPLFGLTKDEREIFENTVLCYNINFGRFQKPFEGAIKCKGGEEEIRRRLTALAEKIPEEATTKDYCRLLKSVAEEYLDEEKVSELLADIQKTAEAEVNLQAVDQIQTILEELEELCPEEVIPLKTFAFNLGSAIGALEISLIPQSLDSVFMGDIHESRYDKLKALFVICASAENLPVPHAYQSIISMNDMDALLENSFRLYPTPLDLIREEEFLLLELFTKVSDRLYIGGSTATQDGSPVATSAVVKEIKALLCKDKYESLFEKYAVGNAVDAQKQEDFAVTRENAIFSYLAYYDTAVSFGGNVEAVLANIYASLTDEQRVKVDKLLSKEKEKPKINGSLYFNKYRDEEFKGLEGRASSVSQIETFYQCPYKHHLKYGLRLNEREDGSLRVQDVGTFIHDVLDVYLGDVKGDLAQLLAAREKELKDVEDVAKLEPLRLAADRQKAAIDNAIRVSAERNFKSDTDVGLETENRTAVENEARRACEVLTEITLGGLYCPTYTELQFGKSEKEEEDKKKKAPLIPPLEIDTAENKYYFTGKIDRMDAYADEETGKKRAVIIDYKTGKITKNPDYDLYLGDKLQLFLYQYGLMELGYVPAGAFYVPIRDGYDKTKFKASGCCDSQVPNIRALDRSVYYRALGNDAGIVQSDCYPITAKLDRGKIVATGGCYFTEEMLTEAYQYAKSRVAEALKNIEEGYIEASPLSGCGYCSYRDICESEGKQNRRVKPNVRRTRETVFPDGMGFVKYEPAEEKPKKPATKKKEAK